MKIDKEARERKKEEKWKLGKNEITETKKKRRKDSKI